MGSQYRRGADFEYRVRDDFEAASYYVVRSAGSGGVADLVAIDLLLPKARPVLVQCKRAGASMSVQAWNHLLRISNQGGCDAVAALEDRDRPLGYDLLRLRLARGGGRRLTKADYDPWPLNPDRDRPQTLPARPSLCECGHAGAEHEPNAGQYWCTMCPCARFQEWRAAVRAVQNVVVTGQDSSLI